MRKAKWLSIVLAASLGLSMLMPGTARADSPEPKTAAETSDNIKSGTPSGNTESVGTIKEDSAAKENKTVPVKKEDEVKLQLTPDNISLGAGETTDIKVEGLPENLNAGKLVCTCIPENVIKFRLNENTVKIEAIKSGGATLTASFPEDPEHRVTCAITVQSIEGLHREKDGTLVYYQDGKPDNSFTGFAEFEGSWYYAENGFVSSRKTSIVEGKIAGEQGWWYIKDSKFEKIDSIEQNTNGWWYLKDGKVDFFHSGVEQNKQGWWKVTNGKVDFSFTGFANNINGWWYLKNGNVQFQTTSVVEGDRAGHHEWWFVKKGKIQFINSVESNSNGWWKITNGRVDFNFTGFANNINGWWYLKNGKVQFQTTGVVEGDRSGYHEWWFVKSGKIQFINSVESNANGWWKITNGRVDFGYNGNYTSRKITYRIINGHAYAYTSNNIETLLSQTKTAGKTSQIILVWHTNGTHYQSTLYHKINGQWKNSGIGSNDTRVGRNGLNYSRHTGDLSTPIGSFPLTEAFGRKANPGTSMTYHKVTNRSYWGGEAAAWGKYRNRYYEGSHALGHVGEHLIDHSQYNYALNIGFNYSPVITGKGCAIFLHGNGNASTAGCVSVPETVCKEYVKAVRPGAYIIIIPGLHQLTDY